jgi:hypothetical protein
MVNVTDNVIIKYNNNFKGALFQGLYMAFANKSLNQRKSKIF